MVIRALAGLIVSLQMVAASGQPAEVLYALRTSSIYANTAGHRTTIGSVTPGTPLQASGGVERGFQAFTLDAWSQQGDDTTLFATQGQRIVLATLTDDVAHLEILATVKDGYGNVWKEVELSGVIQASELTSDQDTVWAQAKALYSSRCSACHALHHTNEFTANQWPTILKTMTKNAALQPDQAALITQYLQTHSK